MSTLGFQFSTLEVNHVIPHIPGGFLDLRQFCAVVHCWHRTFANSGEVGDWEELWQALGWRDPAGSGWMTWDDFLGAIVDPYPDGMGERMDEEEEGEMKAELATGTKQEVRMILVEHGLVGNCLQEVCPAKESLISNAIVRPNDARFHPAHGTFLERCRVFDALLLGSLGDGCGPFETVLRDAHLMEYLWHFVAPPDVEVKLVRWRIAALALIHDLI